MQFDEIIWPEQPAQHVRMAEAVEQDLTDFTNRWQITTFRHVKPIVV